MPAINASAVASSGMRQSPRGDRLTVPTFGPGGSVVRLNCWLKNLPKNSFIQRFTVSFGYAPSKLSQASA